MFRVPALERRKPRITTGMFLTPSHPCRLKEHEVPGGCCGTAQV